jgi:hypothetical protein
MTSGYIGGAVAKGPVLIQIHSPTWRLGNDLVLTAESISPDWIYSNICRLRKKKPFIASLKKMPSSLRMRISICITPGWLTSSP